MCLCFRVLILGFENRVLWFHTVQNAGLQESVVTTSVIYIMWSFGSTHWLSLYG